MNSINKKLNSFIIFKIALAIIFLNIVLVFSDLTKIYSYVFIAFFAIIIIFFAIIIWRQPQNPEITTFKVKFKNNIKI
jgi:hypothetical protein